MSQPGGHGLSVLFYVQPSEHDKPNAEDFILCWVSEEGELEHYYRLRANDRHTECTQTAHAFVVQPPSPSPP